MHMADALISPAVGGTILAVTAGITAYSVKIVQKELDERKVPLMGVLGAFIFAAQMINFSIPGTGSSGHLGGGLLLTILLGPYAGFLTMASILTIQALFFADGGFLALGCNIFNLGFYACFLAYPLIYKPITKNKPTQIRIILGALTAAVIGLQLGSFSVVLETLFSGKTELPFKTFLLLMQPLHLVIGIVEGIITAAVVSFIWKARPEIIDSSTLVNSNANRSMKGVLIGLLIAAVTTAGVLSWFASTHPDGLEWSMFHASGKDTIESKEEVHQLAAKLQEKTAILPDYDFKKIEPIPAQNESKKDSSRSIINAGTSIAGLAGTGITLILLGAIGFGLHLFKKRV